MLKGQAKTDYMGEYMSRKRAEGRLLDPSVRPIVQPTGLTEAEFYAGIKKLRESGSVFCDKPDIDADGNVIYEEG